MCAPRCSGSEGVEWFAPICTGSGLLRWQVVRQASGCNLSATLQSVRVRYWSLLGVGCLTHTLPFCFHYLSIAEPRSTLPLAQARVGVVCAVIAWQIDCNTPRNAMISLCLDVRMARYEEAVTRVRCTEPLRPGPYNWVQDLVLSHPVEVWGMVALTRRSNRIQLPVGVDELS